LLNRTIEQAGDHVVDKLKAIEDSGQEVMASIGGLIALTPEEILRGMRHVMDPKELQMFDLADFCEGETIKAQNANAHFAACLMGAAMNEAILAFMCLRFESDVRATKQFGYSTRKRPREFREVVGDWSFEQFISVAEQLEWIPAHIVDEPYKDVLAEGFRELMPVTHPEMSSEEIEAGASSFYKFPGTAMLRMTQELRNAVHAGRWLRGKAGFVLSILHSGAASPHCLAER
jgi:hypothetical protein